MYSLLVSHPVLGYMLSVQTELVVVHRTHVRLPVVVHCICVVVHSTHVTVHSIPVIVHSTHVELLQYSLIV